VGRRGERGLVVAQVLTGAWRAVPPAPAVAPPALDAVAPLLHKSGAASLAWWRIRETPLADTPAGEDLRTAYRLNHLEAEVRALKMAAVLRRLERAGVETLLVKGWAIARQYPEVGLRPYSDVDLVVRPGQMAAARAAVLAPASLDDVVDSYPVDLHDGPARLDALSFDDLASRAQRVGHRDQSVQVLGPEDHLRVLALHALRHGVFRPIWLVDLAVAVEARPSTFDWTRCLGPDARRADWVTCAVALAHRLLGASVEGTPAAPRARSLPRWLLRAVLRAWDHCEGTSHREPIFPALARRLGRPGQLWREARSRWDRPIQATLEVGGPFDRFPRWPLQVAAVVSRASEVRQALRVLLSRREG
jgi:hypothetical protein